MQTRIGSFAESIVNVLVGFGVAFVTNIVVLPWFGFAVTGSQAFGIGLIFTVVSVIRSYWLRRLFNSISWGNFKRELEQ